MSRFGRHLKNRMLRFPAQILSMMGFSSCDNSDIFQWPKLVSVGGSYSVSLSCLQRPDWWTIEGEMTIFWSITKLGRSVRRVIREGSLALFRTSYKELSQRGIHPSSGVHHLFLKRDKFHSESAGFTLAITCLPHISSSS